MLPKNTNSNTSSSQPKLGLLKRGWLLTKASYGVLKLDKELIIIPFFGLIASIAVVGAFCLLGWMLLGGEAGINELTSSQTDGSVNIPLWVYPLMFLLYFAIFSVVNFFSAGITYAALERFRGNDPTIKRSLRAITIHIGDIITFSFFQAVIIYILELLKERLSFAGRLLTTLGGVAFTLATFFVIPVIVESDETLGPWKATKKSAEIIKKSWSETITVSFGIGTIAVLSGIIYTTILTTLWAIPLNLGVSGGAMGMVFGLSYIVLLFFGYISIGLIYGTLSSIAVVALYLHITEPASLKLIDSKLIESSVKIK